MNRPFLRATAVLGAAALIAAGCGNSSGGGSSAKPTNPNGAEVSPPGDIPDDQAFVAHAGKGFTVDVPEGWARTTKSGDVTFTDKLNSVTISGPAAKTAAAVAGGRTSAVTRAAGKAQRTTYLATSAQDPVTGKTHQDAVERYEFSRSGKHVVLTLAGPKGADNVDPWKIITDSFAWTR